MMLEEVTEMFEDGRKRYTVSLFMLVLAGCSYVPPYTSEGVTGGEVFETESTSEHEFVHGYDYPMSLRSAYYDGYYYPYPYYGIYSVPPPVPVVSDSSPSEPESDSEPPAGGQSGVIPAAGAGIGRPRTAGSRPRSGGSARLAVPKSVPAAPIRASAPATPIRAQAPRSSGSGSRPARDRR